MRKLSVLIAMILCVTIGGVYASWTYADGTAGIKNHTNKTIQLSTVISAGSVGEFGISHNINGFEISETSTDDKTAQIVATYHSGDKVVISLSFTPVATASDEVKENGIEAYVYVDTEQNITWNNADLFTFKHNDENAIVISPKGTAGAANVWEKAQDSATLTCNIELALADFIALGSVFKLENIDDYRAFETALKNGKTNADAQIHIHVTADNPKA